MEGFVVVSFISITVIIISFTLILLWNFYFFFPLAFCKPPYPPCLDDWMASQFKQHTHHLCQTRCTKGCIYQCRLASYSYDTQLLPQLSYARAQTYNAGKPHQNSCLNQCHSLGCLLLQHPNCILSHTRTEAELQSSVRKPALLPTRCCHRQDFRLQYNQSRNSQ